MHSLQELVYVSDVGLNPSKNPKNFDNETIALIYERDEYHCQACGRGDRIMEAVPHHVFFKSQVSAMIANWPENGVLLCKNCHRLIHQPGSALEAAYGAKYDSKLKSDAVARFRETGDTVGIVEVEKVMREIAGKPLNDQPIGGILLL